jgi:AcrR family transcriptional regulator
MGKSGAPSGTAVRPGEVSAIDPGPFFQKLKPGPGLPAEHVRADQRRRLHAATIALVDRDRSHRVKVRDLAHTAGVSTATFYRHFLNADECLASTYDAAMDTIIGRAAAAQRSVPGWEESVRLTVSAVLGGVAIDPRVARLALVTIYGAGPEARKRIGVGVERFEALIAACFRSAPPGVSPPRHLIAGMTAGMLRVARAQTFEGRVSDPTRSADQIAEWMLALPDTEVLSLSPGPKSSKIKRRETHPFPTTQDSERSVEIGDDRQRLMRAAIRLATPEGFAKLTVSQLRAETGISRRRFDSCFGSLEDCFLDALDSSVGDAVTKAGVWATAPDRWEQRVCRFVLALCAQAARDRGLARLTFLGIFAAGLPGLLGRERMIGRAAAGLRTLVPPESQPSPIVAEASVAAVWHIVQSDIAANRSRGLPLVAPLLSYVLLAPIIGAPGASEAIHAEFEGFGSVGKPYLKTEI